MLSKLRYLFKSIMHKYDNGHNCCPSCGSRAFFQFPGNQFRKFVTTLRYCLTCHLQYRHPTTSKAESLKFYEAEYEQLGLTTDLPDSRTISRLIETNFRNSEKDFSCWIPLFQKLSRILGRKLRVLDYGANWGYTIHQLQQQDYISHCAGFELSKARREFGKQQLGVDYIELDSLDHTFDVVFSSHVIEHMYNPSLFRAYAEAALTTDGFVVLTCPNGSHSSIPFHANWRKNWGEVHPNMISDKYLITLFENFYGCVSDEILTDEHMDMMLSTCDARASSLLPTTPNLVAIFKRATQPILTSNSVARHQ